MTGEERSCPVCGRWHAWSGPRGGERGSLECEYGRMPVEGDRVEEERSYCTECRRETGAAGELIWEEELERWYRECAGCGERKYETRRRSGT